MDAPSLHALEAHYKRSFGWLAGYLPPDHGDLLEWQETLRVRASEHAAGRTGYQHESVAALDKLIATNGIVRLYVTDAIAQAKIKNVTGIENMLWQLDLICITAPRYNADPSKRVLFPMSSLFVNMMATEAGKGLFRLADFNEGLRKVLQTWADYLDSADSRSVLNKDPQTGWLGTAAIAEFKLDDFEIDWNREYGGFASYNAFFHREIKSSCRPLAGAGDPAVVTAPNDGTVYRIARDVQADAIFWIKEKAYSLNDMLNYPAPEVLDRYIGGTVVQVFLSGADYHRWHAPVDGVLSWEFAPGLLFSENDDDSFDPDAGVASQVYGSAVNNRGLTAIATGNPRIGTVYVMPIGITEISSVTNTAPAGQPVRKGDELGYFNYGGSTLCVIFEKGTLIDFGGLKEKDTIEVNARLATIAHPI